MAKISELRRDHLAGQWVLIAGERGSRPNEHARAGPRSPVSPYSERCPFCPGNEASTPPAVLELPGPSDGARWQVRAFPNKYAALTPEAPPADSDHGRFFASLPGEGVHEVLVESPEHDRSPSSMTEGEMTCVVRAYARRYAALMAGPAIEYVLVFKNHGEEAGTSLRHLHSQIIATPFVPDDVRRKGSIAETHYRQTGECLLCRTVEEEVRCGARIVHGDEQYVVFHPFASSRFAETWIVPLDHRPSFGRASPGNLARLGRVLSRTMKQLSVAFGDPDFNYILHSCPRACEDTAQAYWHWYLQIVPRVAKAAGVELGTGIHINTGWPEETAEAMRRIRP